MKHNHAGLLQFSLRCSTLIAGLLGLGCRVDEQAFQDRIFLCDTSAADPLCGTDGTGQPMTCYAARQIGASDFCTQECGDVPMSLPDGTVCVQGNAKLKACDPNDDNDRVNHPNGACDRSQLGCLRTDLVNDEGVCLTMNPCLTDTDCHDPVLSVCAATFYKQLYSQNTTFHADHLYCLQEGCQTDNTSCSPGQSCLRDVIPASAAPPDICVPNCDSNLHCPPNHFCLRKVSGPANPAVCIPGLLGFVCDTDVDCMIGKCLDDGGTGTAVQDHLNLCTISCTNDNDCSVFDSQQGLFFCNQSNNTCTTPNAYRGATCVTDDDCTRDEGSICSRFAPTDAQGTCLHPCDATTLACLPRGGVSQTCIPLVADNAQVPVCFPGLFGLPCTDDSNCVGVGEGATCRGQDPTTNNVGFCTALCTMDSDCSGNRWTIGGWCGISTGAAYCIPPQATGQACTRPSMCTSGICGTDNLCG